MRHAAWLAKVIYHVLMHLFTNCDIPACTLDDSDVNVMFTKLCQHGSELMSIFQCLTVERDYVEFCAMCEFSCMYVVVRLGYGLEIICNVCGCHGYELSCILTSSFHNNGTQSGVRVESEPGQA